MLKTPFWVRTIERFTGWKCCYLTSTEIRFERKPTGAS
jgi:hypothetical protein